MREIKLSGDELVETLLNLENERNVCILDSCGVNHLNSHLLIAGFNPVEVLQITNDNPTKTLRILDEKLSHKNLASIFTISYDFGLKLENIKPRDKEFYAFDEPDLFLALFEFLVVHDYNFRKTFIVGNEKKFNEIERILRESLNVSAFRANIKPQCAAKITSNFTRQSYIAAINKIKEYIRQGDTYQTNLTQQLRAELPENLAPQMIFHRLRKQHPAPFAAFINRQTDFVVSISPERFFKVQSAKSKFQNPSISASPIKGTRPRGRTKEEDLELKKELLASAKDRAENVMIVDLLRNDIGKVCEFGSVEVEKLCELEEHPTVFHLVSTINGKLRKNLNLSDIIKAVFPCGSITGAPKIRTMQIIDEIETVPRGLSMGAIGYSIPNSKFQIPNSKNINHLPYITHYLDLSVAIRTIVIKGNEAIFNVGGGIVIDSVPEEEYNETFVKAQALLRALGVDLY
ncbi:MAG: aminodeoxychorismate synthase component I [Acidobacteria bacterium]|jgi:para-aminobenzoate synthetase component 1|nr:aminodeoxychorismate synthase component I [Acidobacteriota bacterium]